MIGVCCHTLATQASVVHASASSQPRSGVADGGSSGTCPFVVATPKWRRKKSTMWSCDPHATFFYWLEPTGPAAPKP